VFNFFSEFFLDKDLCAKITDFAENIFTIFKLGERSNISSDFVTIFTEPKSFEMSLSSSADIFLASDLVESACSKAKRSKIEKIKEKRGYRTPELQILSY
jgi:hypothetical protein